MNGQGSALDNIDLVLGGGGACGAYATGALSVPLPEHRDQARWSSGRARKRRSGRTSRDTTITRCAGIEYLATPELGAEHILACSAIPALFPAVCVPTPQQAADCRRLWAMTRPSRAMRELHPLLQVRLRDLGCYSRRGGGH